MGEKVLFSGDGKAYFQSPDMSIIPHLRFLHFSTISTGFSWRPLRFKILFCDVKNQTLNHKERQGRAKSAKKPALEHAPSASAEPAPQLTAA